MSSYDAILFLSFGGPEGPDDVMPFLHNVLRGKNVPEARMKEVAHHYDLFDGISPINGQNRALIANLEAELKERSINVPIYWGNRNWHPMLGDTLKQMQKDGVKKALAFVTSAYSSYSGCRQYLEDIVKAKEETQVDIEIHKLRVFYNHPLFIEANIEHVRAGLSEFNESDGAVAIAYTAHSIPNAMAQTCAYTSQLHEASQLVSKGVGHRHYKLVYQSRSGPPSQPWLEPDICDHLKELHSQGIKNVLVHPIGFISDHMEIVYDLDTEARALAAELGMKLVRSRTAGTNKLFQKMMGDLVAERLESTKGVEIDRPTLGCSGPAPHFCSPECCAYSPLRPAQTAAANPSRPSK
jgi:protoporphyrin/coproporphyrin ferrochelatase